MGEFLFTLISLEMVVKAPRVMGGSPVSMRVALLAEEVMCLGLRKWQQPNIWWSLRRSKAFLVSDRKAVSYGRMSGIYCEVCNLALYEEAESTLGGVVEEGVGVGWFEGVISN